MDISLNLCDRYANQKNWGQSGGNQLRWIAFVTPICFGLWGCVPIGDWSYAGLNYSVEDDAFSGVPVTTTAQMPSSGSATYSGRYKGGSYANLFADGNASLGVDFGLRSVSLTLTGELNGTSTGAISGTGFQSYSLSNFYFDGSFYGSDAGIAAGNFSGWAGVGNPASGEFIVKK